MNAGHICFEQAESSVSLSLFPGHSQSPIPTLFSILDSKKVTPEQFSPLAIRQPLHHPVHHRQAADAIDLRELPFPAVVERLFLLPMV
jgi:hypothetical protein